MGIKYEPTFFFLSLIYLREQISNVFINLGFEGKSNKNKAKRLDYYCIQISFLFKHVFTKTMI